MTSLREKMKQELQLRGYSIGTQANYLKSVIKLYNFYKCNPAKLGTVEMNSVFFSVR